MMQNEIVLYGLFYCYFRGLYWWILFVEKRFCKMFPLKYSRSFCFVSIYCLSSTNRAHPEQNCLVLHKCNCGTISFIYHCIISAVRIKQWHSKMNKMNKMNKTHKILAKYTKNSKVLQI